VGMVKLMALSYRSLAPYVQNFTLMVFLLSFPRRHNREISTNQMVRDSRRPGIGACTLREIYRKSHECPHFSKAMGAAGSNLE
jgi:hypothetical protein